MVVEKSRDLQTTMVLHGAVVVVLGLLAGLPYGLVVTGALAGETRAWSMAHLEGVLNGLLVLAVAAVFRRLHLSEGQKRLVVWSLVLMAYGNLVASVVGAVFGVRGLEPTTPAVNLLVYGLFMVAVVAAFVGLGLVVYGAIPARRDRGDHAVS